jgi:putative adhesin
MDVPGISRLALVAMIVIAVVLFGFGATHAVGRLTERTDTQTRTLAAAPTIVVHTGTGDVRIVAADRTDVRLTTKEKRSIWGGGRVRVSGGAADLRLKDHCDGFPLVDDPCSVDSVLEVPRATSVRVVTGTGDLRAENLEGSAELRAGTGDLHAVGVTGPLRLRSDTGDVHVEGSSSDVVARTSTGDIRVEATRPGTIDAQADTGDIHISVPDLTYAVDVQTDTGDDNIDVRPDDASPRKVRAHTQTGDVHLEADG